MAESLSVVLPAFNEAGGIGEALRRLRAELADLDPEVVVSDDGSTDATAAEVEALGDPRVRLIRNAHKGRGAALRAGMAAATGDVLVTVDADLSYGPEEVRKLFDHLKAHPECDLVIGSCWMPGGRVEGVPIFRAWVSRVGNRILQFAFEGRFWTTTGILRGYRRERLRDLLPLLASDGKAFHVEILDRAVRAGWKGEEIPAVLVWKRKGGGGGIRLGDGATHLRFLLYRRSDWSLPAILGLQLPLLVGWCLFSGVLEALSGGLRQAQPWLWGVGQRGYWMFSLPALAGIGMQWGWWRGRKEWGGQLAEPDPHSDWVALASAWVTWIVTLLLVGKLLGWACIQFCLSYAPMYWKG